MRPIEKVEPVKESDKNQKVEHINDPYNEETKKGELSKTDEDKANEK